MASNNTAEKSGIENIDWSKEWARVYEQSSISMRRSDRTAYWEKRAARFSTMDNGAAGRVQALLDSLEVNGNTTILDIGCGPGNLALPLAESAKSITALDPAKAMLEILEDRARTKNISNIQTIHNDWDQAIQAGVIEPHDIVLSSYSLIMKDIGKALVAMNEAAKQTVCIFWFASKESFGYDKFWPALFGEEYSAGPTHTILLNILNGLGITPEVSIIPQQHVTSYANIDDAVECWAENLYVSSRDEEDIIREILMETLDMQSDTPTLKRNVQSAMIWWHKK